MSNVTTIEDGKKKTKKGGPDAEKINWHAKRIGAAKADLDKCRGEHGQLWKDAEDGGMNKAALKLAMKIRDMDGTKAQVFWRDLEQYMHALGVFDQLSMFDQLEQQAAE